MSDDSLFHKLLILRLPRVGPVKYAELMAQFKSPAAVVEFLNPDVRHIDMVRREMDAAAKLNIQYLSDDSGQYPQNLKEIKAHPPVLSVRGRIDALQKPAVAIVGTRHATGAGLRFTSDLAYAFAEHGYAVVSGMAMGTDTAAHMGALASGRDATTIAVLAGGADVIWPLENERLYAQILECGCVVSEMPVGAAPSASLFAQRNRWIAGLSEKLILGEADAKSGSVITANFMLEMNRPVYAIPSHPSDARGAGPNRLIRDGLAILCTGADDFFGEKDGAEKRIGPPQKWENTLLDKLGNIPMPESVLAELVKKEVGEIKRELVMLELSGVVKKQDGGYVKI